MYSPDIINSIMCRKTVFAIFLLANAVTCFLPNNIFSTGDPRLFEIFCAEDAGELEKIRSDTMTHDDITIAGIRRSIIGFFNDQDPDLNLDVSSNLSLSSIYTMVNGNCASPYNFVKAAKDIVDTNIAMDILPVIKDDPKFHFDAEFILESQDLLVQRHSQIISAATIHQQYQSARFDLGKSLHAIQKFYSHTNWIEMGNEELNFGLGVPVLC